VPLAIVLCAVYSAGFDLFASDHLLRTFGKDEILGNTMVTLSRHVPYMFTVFGNSVPLFINLLDYAA
jgi:hypothetical protein